MRYEPGEIKVVCYDEKGNVAGEETVRTAGKANRLSISGDKILSEQPRTLKADGEDMVSLTVSAVDKNGTLCPTANNSIKVRVKGNAKFKGICNGDATSLEVFTNPEMRLFNGQLVIGIQATEVPGAAEVTVTGKGLKSATVKLQSK